MTGAALLALAMDVGAAGAAEPVTFVLNWVAGGDHAPVYWAKEQGWYADAGIDLTIEEGRGRPLRSRRSAPAPPRSASPTWRPRSRAAARGRTWSA